MKKLFIALGIIVLCASTVWAVKQINLQNTQMREVTLKLNYDAEGVATADIQVLYDVSNTDGSFLTRETKDFAYDSLPNNVKNSLATFLKHIDQEFRTEKVNENNSDMVFK